MTTDLRSEIEAPAADGARLLDGLRVVELGSSAAVAMAGMALADQGAEVVLVEPPGGHPLRALPAFRMWARGKQSAQADLRTPPGRERARALAAAADLALVGLKPASAARFGLAPADLAREHPGLVSCSLSGFGARGPHRDLPLYEGSVAALGGRMFEFAALAGGARPVFAAAPVIAHAVAMLLLQGAFAALRERERTGRGQPIETSLAQALSLFDLTRWMPDAARELRLADAPFLPYSVARTADGVWIQFAQNGPALFADFLRVVELEGAIDYREAMGFAKPEALRAFRARLLERVARKSWAEWQSITARERNLSVEPFWRPGEALAHPQLLHLGDSREVADPALGATQQLGPLFDVRAAPGRPSGPAPEPGSLAQRGFASPRAARREPALAAARAPLLAGVVVLEFGSWIATPFAASLLADLGARVIKLEPLEGDPMRRNGSVAWKTLQGKQSLALDLKRPEAREIVRRLGARADALIHGYRPGVVERLGIDFASLARENPRLVYVSNGAYGSSGPKAHAPAFHVTGGALCGGARAQAGAGALPPADAPLTPDETARIARRLELGNESNPDFNSAVVAAAALLLGLFARERRGRGVEIETRMMLSNAMMMSADFIDYAGRPERPAPDAELYGLSPLYRLYRAREGWLFLAAASERDVARLGEVLALEELSFSGRFGSAALRSAHADALAALLAARFAERDARDWERGLAARGVSGVAVHFGPFPGWLFEQPWAREQGFVAEVADSAAGRYTRYGPALTSACPQPVGGVWRCGEHTREILAELGYAEGEIGALVASGAVAAP